MKAIFSIFPKFFQHLSAEQLAEMIHEVGLDTTNLVIRDGYWVSMANLAKEASAFLKTMNAAGLDVRFATTSLSADQVIADPAPLSILADNGIREFRMDYFWYPGGDTRGQICSARGQIEKMVAACERANIRAVLQVHHGTITPSASAAYHLVNGLPHKYIGVELDPGNQTWEGYERIELGARLLDEYFVAAGIKDTTLTRDPSKADQPNKGWQRQWAPLDEGVIDWHEFIEVLTRIRWQGTFVFMPFYNEREPDELTRTLKREVAYLRQITATVGGAS